MEKPGLQEKDFRVSFPKPSIISNDIAAAADYANNIHREPP